MPIIPAYATLDNCWCLGFQLFVTRQKRPQRPTTWYSKIYMLINNYMYLPGSLYCQNSPKMQIAIWYLSFICTLVLMHGSVKIYHMYRLLLPPLKSWHRIVPSLWRNPLCTLSWGLKFFTIQVTTDLLSSLYFVLLRLLYK